MNVLALDWPICWNDCVDFVYGAENFQRISTGMAIAKLVLISQFWLRLIDDRAFSEVLTSPNCQRISSLICLNCGVRVFVFFWNFGPTRVLRASSFSNWLFQIRNRLLQIQNRLFQIQFFCTNFDKKDPKNYEKKNPVFHLEL